MNINLYFCIEFLDEIVFEMKIISLIHDKRVVEFLKFGIVGSIAMVIHLGIYYILMNTVDKNVAYSIGYFTSFLCNFFMTSFFTFKVTPTFSRFAKFCGSHLVNYFIYIGLFNFFLLIGLSPQIAPLPVYLIAVPTSFILVRFSMVKKIRFKR